MGFTLVDLHTGYDRELLELASGAGLSCTLDDVHRAMKLAWQEQVKRDATATWEPSPAADQEWALVIDRDICCSLGLRDAEMHARANAISRHLFHDPASYTVFPDVMDTLNALRSMGVKLGIISNWGWHLQDLCAQLGLAHFFDFIVSSARVGASKPHPAIFRAALAQAGMDPREVLHVGDTLAADVLGPQVLGITGVLLDRGGRSPATEGYAVVSSLAEIPGLLAGSQPSRR